MINQVKNYRNILFSQILIVSVVVIYFGCTREKMGKEYYNTGEIKKEIIYKNRKDTSDVKVIGYYRSGKTQYYTNYKNGIREGEYKSFYEDGFIKDDLNFNKGKLYGVQRRYNKKHELYEESLYIDGKLLLTKEFRINPVYKLSQTRIFLTKDTTLFRVGEITYDSIGNVIENASYFYDIIGPDTVARGSMINFLIKFYNKRDDFYFELCLGTLMPDLTLSDTLFRKVTMKDTISYYFYPEKTGKNLITGIVYLKKDTINLKFPFYKEIFVKN